MITPTQTANLIAYMQNFQALTITSTIAATWCDFLNSTHGAPEASYGDYQEATRAVCDRWARQEGFRNRLTPADLVREVKGVRRRRLNAWEDEHGPLVPPLQLCDDPRKAQAWMIEQRQAIMDGQTPQNALERDGKSEAKQTPMPIGRGRLRAI